LGLLAGWGGHTDLGPMRKSAGKEAHRRAPVACASCAHGAGLETSPELRTQSGAPVGRRP